MNAPFVVAQAVTTGQGITTGQNPATPPKVVKLVKPQGDQAIVVNMDGNTRLDFSGIAGEKITLVHVGERLIILFDNKATVTIDPFFDSSGKPLQLGGIDLDGNRIVSAEEFASLFPITEDQSILPAAGGQGSPQNTGGQFASFTIQDLLGDTPLDLLPPEQLGNFVVEPTTNPLLDEPVDLFPGQITSARLRLTVEEEHQDSSPSEGEEQSSFRLAALGSGGIGGNEDPNDDTSTGGGANPDGLDQDTNGNNDNTTLTVHGTGVNSLTSLISGGNPPLTFSIIDITSDGNPNNDAVKNESGGDVYSQGEQVFYTVFDSSTPGETTVEAWTNPSEGGEPRLIFTVTVETNGDWTFTLFDQLDHPAKTFDNGTLSQGDLEEILGIDLTGLIQAVDSNGSTILLQPVSGEPVFVLDVIDDTPIANGEVITAKIDEDDIRTPWSQGTSPNDGDADGSITEGNFGPAYIDSSMYGGLAGLVSIGADELPYGVPMFSFTSNVIPHMEDLGLYSKNNVQPASENGLPLYYQTSSSGDWNVLSAYEPDTPGPGNTGNPVFEFHVNQVTGEWEFRLFDELIHKLEPSGDPDQFDLRSNLTTISGIDFGAILQATDADGDSVSLAGKFIVQVHDDKPEADIDLRHGKYVIHDETPGDDGSHDTSFNSLPSVARIAFSALLNTGNDLDVAGSGAIGYAYNSSAIVEDNSVIGADAPAASRVFSLAINGGDGTDSGLDITEGFSILLYKEGDLIVGRVQGGTFDGKAAFAIHINQSGEISVAHYLSMKHDDINDHDEWNDNGQNSGDDQGLDQFPNPVQQTLEGKINAVLTVTDSDGDVDSASVDIGERIVFEDDGPKVELKLKHGAALIHDETPGIDNPDDDVAGTTAFGAGTLASTFAGVSPAGDDLHVMDHPIGYALSDGPIVQFDELSYGADGGATENSIVYSLVIKDNDSGLETTEGREIKLFKEGDLIVGRYDSPNDGNSTITSSDPAAFAIAFDPATGKLALVQFVSIWHPNEDDHDDTVTLDSNSLSLRVTVTDGDGDYDIDDIDISKLVKFEDDGPSVTATPNSQFSVVHDETTGQQGDDKSGSLPSVFSGLTTGSYNNDPHAPPSGNGPIGFASSAVSVFSSVTPNYGADGPGSPQISYSLDLKVANGTSSGLTVNDATGGAAGNGMPRTVYLFQVNANLIVGTFDGSGIGPDGDSVVEASDAVAFAVAIDPATGIVHVVQYLSVNHSNSMPDLDPDEIAYLAENLIAAVVTVEDGDEDTASYEVLIGDKIGFRDDGPVANIAPKTGAEIRLDETDNDADDGAVGGILATRTVAAATLFNDSSAFGSDGPKDYNNNNVADADATVWSLQLNAGATNLLDAQTDENIVLSTGPGGVIQGKTQIGGLLVFEVSINTATGAVTVTQHRAVEHNDPADHDEAGASSAVMSSGLIEAKVTLTDDDGDTHSDTAELGSLIKFEDDGPKIISVVQGATYGAELIENGGFEQGIPNLGSDGWGLASTVPGWTKGGDNIPFEIQQGSTGGLAAFDNYKIELDSDTEAPNNTGQTNATIQQEISGLVAGQQYELTFYYSPRGDAGVGSSGMDVSFTGNPVYSIPSNANLPVGWVKHTVVFTATGPTAILAFTATGSGNEYGAFLDNVSLRAIYQGPLDDEDTSLSPAAEVQGGPGDDGSGIVVTGKINFDPGSDGLKSISIGGIAGLKAIWVDGNNVGHPELVTYQWVADGKGGTLYGLTSHFNTIANPAFEITVNADGDYVFTLYAPLNHPLQDNPGTDALETSFEDNLLLDFPIRIVDGDNDTTNGVVRINVDDDSPEFTSEIEDGVVTALNTPVTHDLNFVFGADGQHVNNGVKITGWTNLPGIAETLSPDGKTLTATIDGSGQILYTLTLNSDGTYTYTQANLPTAPAPLTDVSLMGAFAPAVEKDFGAFKAIAPAGDTVNGSAQGFGVNSGASLDDGESVYFVFDNPMTVASFHFKQEGGGAVTISWKAINTATGEFETGSFVVPTSENGSNAYPIDILGNLDPTLSSFDRLELTATASNGGKVKIQSLGGTQLVPQEMPDVTFQVTGVDGDGDGVSASFTVDVNIDDAPTAANDVNGTSDAAGDNAIAGSNADAFVPQSAQGSLNFDFGDNGPHATTPFAVAYDGGLGAGSTSSSSGTTTIAGTGWALTINESTGDYTFNQTAPYQHDTGATTDAGIFTVTLLDGDGDPVVVTLTINVGDDGVTADDDTGGQATEGGAALTGNVLVNDDLGADHGTVGTDGRVTQVTHGLTTQAIAAGGSTSIAGDYGTLTLFADGSYSYAPFGNLNNPVPVQDQFTYAITDKDTDTDTAVLTFTVADGTGPSVVTTGTTIAVDEEGLNNTNATGTDAGDGSHDDTGTVTFQAGSDDITSVAFGPTSGITVDVNGVAGDDIVWSPNGANQIVGTINGIEAIHIDLTPPTLPITAGNQDSATVTVTLLDNFPHPNANGENVITLNGISVVATDTDGTQAPAAVSVSVTDDVPQAAGESASVVEPTTMNVVLVLDRSGSMDEASGVLGFDKFALAKQAALNLLNVGNIQHVLIVSFNDSATSHGWFTKDNAVTFLTAFNPNRTGETDYDDAIAEVQDVYSPPPSTTSVTKSYFFSDGAPSDGSSNTISSGEQAAWESFLTTNGIVSYGVGVGGVSQTDPELAQISFPGDSTNTIVLNSTNGLLSTLPNQAASATSGNVLTNDDFGADGGHIQSIQVGTVIYTWDGASTITLSGSASGTIGGSSIGVTTPLGAAFTFNFATGAWTYTAQSAVSGNTPESFQYVLVDGDGDPSAPANLVVTVLNVNSAPAGTDGEVTALEDQAYAFTAANFGFTDPNDSPANVFQAVKITSLETAGDIELNGVDVTVGQVISKADIDAGLLTFAGASNANGNNYASFTFQVQDGGGTANGGADLDPTANAMTIDVTAVNDAPTIGGLTGGGTYTENASPILIDTSVTVGDIDSSNFNGGSLTVAFAANGTSADQLTIVHQGTSDGQIGVSGSNITYNPPGGAPNAIIGTWSGGTNGNPLVITFNSATPAAVQALIQRIAYSNSSDDPSTLPRTVSFTLVDGDGTANGGADTVVATATVNVTAQNDAPTVSNVSVTASGIAFTIADPDNTAFSLVAPFAAAFGNPALVLGNNTLTPVELASAVSGTLQVSDGSGGTANVIGLYLGTAGNNTGVTAPLSGSSNAMYSFGGNDSMTGGTAADFFFAGAGNDTINLASGHFVAGEVIDGGADTDTIAFVTTGDGQSVNFTVGTIVNVENLTAVNQGSSNGYDQTFTLTASQWAALSSINMNDGTDTLNVQVSGAVDISSLGTPTITNTENRNLVGGAGASDDTITLTGTQLNAFTSINLGSGNDTINLTSTSTGLNGLSNGSLTGVEAISAASAGAGVTINLGNQSDGFTITGSNHGDVITGSSGNDTIDGGGGADVLNGGSGDDLILYRTGVSSINGGSNLSANLLTAGNRGDVLAVNGTVDFTTLGDIFQGIESISMLDSEGGAGGDTITLHINDVLQMAGETTDIGSGYGSEPTLRIDGSAGDVLNLANDGGTWLVATGTSGVPAGYTAYSHVTSGSTPTSNEDAYLFVATGITVNGVGV